MNLRTCVIVSALLAAAPTAIQAGPREDALHALDQCTAIADEHARVACFDQITPQLKAALGAPASPHAPTQAEQKSWFGFDLGNIFGTSPAQQTTPQQFGSENVPPPPPPANEPPPPGPIESITAKVTNYAMDPFGKFVIFLDNDQVWQQLQGDAEHASFSRGGGDSVTISRGFIGSYNLQINDSNKVFKVKRIK
jgi:hypothetical protein